MLKSYEVYKYLVFSILYLSGAKFLKFLWKMSGRIWEDLSEKILRKGTQFLKRLWKLL